MKFIYLSFLCLFYGSLISCVEVETWAPVTEISTLSPIPKAGIHRVLKGETLYEIAWRYGLDYRYLAKRNKINAPYAIYESQKIYLQDERKNRLKAKIGPIAKQSLLKTEVSYQSVSKRTVPVSPIKKTIPFKSVAIEEPNYLVTKWQWPTKKTTATHILQSGKGINIFGQSGDPIYAAGPGRVVYAGGGLRGLGNLIILKHNSIYLSAYAHNKTILVKEGDWVKQGQKIAEMGHTGTNKVMLHFEIRRGGRPMVPALWLTNQI